MSSITLTATQLRDLVTPVIPHASKDQTLPSLCAVRIRSAGQYVTAIATDRYRIGFQRVTLTEPPAEGGGFDAAVPVAVLKRIMGVFRPTRWHNPVLELAVDGERLRVSLADTMTEQTVGTSGDVDGLAGASLTFALHSGDFPYPALDRLVREALEGVPDEAAMTAVFNPEFLADFRIGQPRHEPMRITATGGPARPWLIRVGDDFIGLLVPVRYGDHTTVPEDTPSWLGLLDVPAEAEKPAAA